MKKWIFVFLIIDLFLVSIFCFLYFNNLLTNPPRIVNNLFNIKFFNNLKENFKNFSSKLSSSISNFYNNIFKNKEEPASEVKNPKKEVVKENQGTEEEKKQIESRVINKKEIELEEIWKYHYGNYFCIFGFLKNMSSDYAATNVSLSCSLYDSEGSTVLKTSESVKLQYILPEQSAPFSLITEISNDIHFESYEIDTIRCSWIPFDIEDTFEFDVSNIDLTYYNSHNLAKGFVKNISKKDLDSAKILVAFYDDKERIIAVGSDYLVNLKVGENIPFIVDTENLPYIQKKAKNIEVFLFPQFDEI
ncbi:MAG: hypothetical protein ABIA56_02770 [Actinomycetota bacterium]